MSNFNHWIFRKWPKDARQACVLAKLEGRRPAQLLERLARDMGYMRATIGGHRRWIKDTDYYRLADLGETNNYRQGSRGHAKARQKVSAEKRQAIAKLGAIARLQRLRNEKQNALSS